MSPRSVTNSCVPPRAGKSFIWALVIEVEETSLSAHVASGPTVGRVGTQPRPRVSEKHTVLSFDGPEYPYSDTGGGLDGTG